MFDHRTIFKREIDAVIDCRADMGQYLLNLGRMHYGRPYIKLDKSLLDILRTFGIKVPDGGNHGLYVKMKNDGVFEDVKHLEDGEYSSINIGFFSLDGFYRFIENFLEWLEKNEDVISRPTVEIMDKEDEIGK